MFENSILLQTVDTCCLAKFDDAVDVFLKKNYFVLYNWGYTWLRE